MLTDIKMKLLITMMSICLFTSPMLCLEKEKVTGRSSSQTSESRGGYGIGIHDYGGHYGGGQYGGGHYGGGQHGGHYGGYGAYNEHQPTKKLYFDLGIPLVVGGLGLGLGVGALKGLLLGALLGKKKHHLIKSEGYGGHGGGQGGAYGGYGGYGAYGGYGLGIGSSYGGGHYKK